MKKRKILMVANQVKMGDEDAQDIIFWINRSASERIAEVTRLRQEYYRWLHGNYPDHIKKTVIKKRL